MEKIPYLLVDKKVLEIETDKSYSVKISDVKFKKKLIFLFQSNNIGDTIYVELVTLNRKILSKKTITNEDFILRYEPFRKSENYYLLIKTVKSKEKKKGCLGLVILERVTNRPFKKIQKIEWKLENIK